MTSIDILEAPPFAEVVISYCAQDLGQALQLADRLKAAGAKCWMADHGHEANLNDRSETIQVVKHCKVVLMLCSDAALRSTRVKQDMQFAWTYERPFLPLLIEPIDFPEQAKYWFEGKQSIEAVGTPPERWLPLVLRALVNIGVQCPGMNPVYLYGTRVIQPTRLDHSLKSLCSDYDRAIQESYRAVELDPNVPRFHTNLGYRLLKAGKPPDDGRKCARKALDIDPNFKSARKLLQMADEVERSRK